MEHSYRAGHNLSLLIYASLETKLAFNNFNMSALLHLSVCWRNTPETVCPPGTCLETKASFVVSVANLTVTGQSGLSHPYFLPLSDLTPHWLHLAQQSIHKSAKKCSTQSRDKEVIKNGGQMNSWRSRVDERKKKNPLCFSLFTGEALITVQVKLNMRDKQSSEGGWGKSGRQEGEQSRGDGARQEPLNPDVLFPVLYLWRKDKTLDKHKNLKGLE